MKNFFSPLVVSFVLSLLSLYSPPSVAQDLDSAAVEGYIRDQLGATLPGASVVITRVRDGATRTTNTDGRGHYLFIQLEPGIYTLTTNLTGFNDAHSAPLRAIAGQNIKFDIGLNVAEVDAGTVVVASRKDDAVDTSRTVVGTSIGSREISDLPLASRSPLDLVFTLPGVIEEALSTRDLAEDRDRNASSTPEESGTMSLAGGTAYSNNFTIDGLDNNDDRAARERFQPPIDAVDEVQVITNQFSAEYGRASGGRVNLRTRSASNRLAGRVFYYFRDESLDANSFNNNASGLKRLPLQEHTPGFTIGGPTPNVWSRHLPSFFFAFEQHRVLDTSLIDTLVPIEQNTAFSLPPPTHPQASRVEIVDGSSLAATIAPLIVSVPTPLTDTSLTLRLDQQLSSLHNGSLVLQLGRQNNLRQFNGGNRLAESLQAKVRNSAALSYCDTFVLSETSVNQLRFQVSELKPSFEPVSRNKPVVLIALNDPLPAENLSRRSGTLVAGSSNSGATQRREDRFQVQDIVSVVRKTHSLKVGLDIHNVRSTFVDLSDGTGTFNFSSAGDFLASVPSRYRQEFGSGSVQQNVYAGAFVQDDWQLSPRILLSYGLRYERDSIIHDTNNFGPRASLAFKPFSSDRFVLRAGAGLFYNRPLLRTIDDFTLGKQQVFFDTNLLVDPGTGTPFNTAERRTFIANNIHFPQTLTADSQIVSQFGTRSTEFSRRLDPHLRIPESYQMNVGFELALGRGYSLESNITYSRGVHLWREFNANAPRLPSSYSNLTDYLLSRDFPNFVTVAGSRPIYSASTAGELVRFIAGPSETNNSVNRVMEFGVPVSIFNLSTASSSTALDAALAAVNDLRPDPGRREIEQLISAGNSFYRSLTIELRKQPVTTAPVNIGFRAGYTRSDLVDDGIVNTSDALSPADFRAERSRSLLDRRHRFVLSGIFELPDWLGDLELSSIFRIASGAPFNISIGGTDRNLDDVGNDRPLFSGDLDQLRWHAPGQMVDERLIALFSLPRIGESGNLRRNSGIGPGLFAFDLNVARVFRLGERVSLRPIVEFDNILNKTVFSFGSEFINFHALSFDATPAQRRAFLETFLVPTRTMRPRQIRLGLKLDF